MFDKKNKILKIVLISGVSVAAFAGISAGIVIGVTTNNNNETNNNGNFNFDISNAKRNIPIYQSGQNKNISKTLISASQALELAKTNNNIFSINADSQHPNLNYTILFNSSVASDISGVINFDIQVTNSSNSSQVFNYMVPLSGFLPSSFDSIVSSISSNFKSLSNTESSRSVIFTQASGSNVTINQVEESTPAEAVAILNNTNPNHFNITINSIYLNQNPGNLVTFKSAMIDPNNPDSGILLKFNVSNISSGSNFDFYLNSSVALSNTTNIINQLNSQITFLQNQNFNASTISSNSNTLIQYSNAFILANPSPSQLISTQLQASNFKINTNSSNFNNSSLSQQRNFFKYTLKSIGSSTSTTNQNNELNGNVVLNLDIAWANNSLVSPINFSITINGFTPLLSAIRSSHITPNLKNASTNISNIFTPGILENSSNVNNVAMATFENLYSLPSAFNFNYKLLSVVPNFQNGSVVASYAISSSIETTIPSNDANYSVTISGFETNFQNFSNANAAIIANQDISNGFVFKNIPFANKSDLNSIDLSTLTNNEINFNFSNLVLGSESSEAAMQSFLNSTLEANFKNSFQSSPSSSIIPTLSISNIQINSVNANTGVLVLNYDLNFNLTGSGISSPLQPIVTKASTTLTGFKQVLSMAQQNANQVLTYLSNESNFVFPNLGNKDQLASTYQISNFEGLALSQSAISNLPFSSPVPTITVNSLTPNNSSASIILTITITSGSIVIPNNSLTITGFLNPAQAPLNDVSTQVSFRGNTSILPSDFATQLESNNAININSPSLLTSIVTGLSFQSNNLVLGQFSINIVPNSIQSNNTNGTLNFSYTIILNSNNNIVSVVKMASVNGFLTTAQNNLNNAVFTFQSTPENQASLALSPSQVNASNFKTLILSVKIGDTVLNGDSNEYTISNLSIDSLDISGTLIVRSFTIKFDNLSANITNSNNGFTLTNLKSSAQSNIEQLFPSNSLPRPSLKNNVTSLIGITASDFNLNLISSDYSFEIKNITPVGTPTTSQGTFNFTIRIFLNSNSNVFIQYNLTNISFSIS